MRKCWARCSTPLGLEAARWSPLMSGENLRITPRPRVWQNQNQNPGFLTARSDLSSHLRGKTQLPSSWIASQRVSRCLSQASEMPDEPGQHSERPPALVPGSAFPSASFPPPLPPSLSDDSTSYRRRPRLQRIPNGWLVPLRTPARSL